MRGRARRVGVAIVLAVAAALASSCSSTPKTVGPCHHVIFYPGPGGGGYVAALDWDNKIHAYGESAPFTACFSFPGNAVAKGQAGVTIDPTEQPIGHGEFGVVTFTVTVTEGSAGPISLRLEYPDGSLFSAPGGPDITPADGGWRFTSPDLS